MSLCAPAGTNLAVGGFVLSAREITATPLPTQAGLSVFEMLVAWTLTLVVLLSGLFLLSALRQTYIRCEMAADATQRVRIATGSLARDLRLAGLGVDPDGAPDRPDETIEGAWAGAIAARGDLDASDPAERDDPERWIAGSYPSTRTGNDEIFAYALRRESGSGGADLVFEADVSSPDVVDTPSGVRVAARDGRVEEVRLTRVVAGNGGSAGPGAILYRATLANNANLWGTGNAIVWQPLADGIATLELHYFDDAGAELPPPGGAETQSQARDRIAAIEVRVVALARQPDRAWTDPADINPATVHYRKAEDRVRIDLRDARPVTRVDRDAGPLPPAP